ncbi:hypothetical protein LTS10_003155 [Elasticomyces elasticus]|nr:hypothetical protein LTS10_003155 [Elasticomyces elasticus]
MVKLRNGGTQAVSTHSMKDTSKNPVACFLNGITTLVTVITTKIRGFAADIATKACELLRSPSASADTPSAALSRWNFLRRITTSTLRVQAKTNEPSTPTPTEPPSSLVVRHLAPIPITQPSAPPRIGASSARTNFLPGPPSFTSADKGTVRVQSNGNTLDRLPERIGVRVERYTDLKNNLEDWLVETAEYYHIKFLSLYLKDDGVSIKTAKHNKLLAKAITAHCNVHETVRENVPEIIDLRGFVASWYEDLLVKRGLSENCDLAAETRSHRYFLGVMAEVLEIFDNEALRF